MAQQGSLYAENGGWFVRYWEIVRQPDGSLKRKHPAHRLASVKDYPRKSEVIPLKNGFMEKLRKIGFTPEAGVSIVDFVENTFFPACERRLSGGGTKCYPATRHWRSLARFSTSRCPKPLKQRGEDTRQETFAWIVQVDEDYAQRDLYRSTKPGLVRRRESDNWRAYSKRQEAWEKTPGLQPRRNSPAPSTLHERPHSHRQ